MRPLRTTELRRISVSRYNIAIKLNTIEAIFKKYGKGIEPISTGWLQIQFCQLTVDELKFRQLRSVYLFLD
jgi:hypothetical protein